MNLFGFLKLFLASMLIFVLSSCSLDIQPPVISSGSHTIENPIVDKNYIKHNASLVDSLAEQSSIKKIEDWEELKDFLENNISSSKPDLNNIELRYRAAELVSNYSKIDLQLVGVDKVDALKTDGNYVYAMSGASIFIIESYPATSAKLLSEIKFSSQPRGFIVTNDRLSVFGDSGDIDSNFSRKSSYSYVKIFDTSDKGRPEETRHLDVEGDYVDARIIGDYMYFVNSLSLFAYATNTPMIPVVLENNQHLDCELINECVIPDIYYFDISYSAYNFTSVSSINIQNAEEGIDRKFYILPESQNIFVSNDSLYITYAKYLSEYSIETKVMTDLIYPYLSDKSKQKIKSIKLAGDFILTKDQKQNKIRTILEYYIYLLDDAEREIFQNDIKQKMIEKDQEVADELNKTVIHQIDLDQGDLTYQGFSEVSGQILNHSAMNKKDDNFFVVTTEKQIQRSYTNEQNKLLNNFYALDKNLEVIGELKGVAVGEQIVAMRFAQDRAYLITLKDDDQLFVIDINYPNDLKMLGKLKIPEPLNYLHIYDDNTLIGLGRNSYEDNAGNVIDNGVKLSLIDVFDVATPKEIDSQALGGAGSDSVALNNHKAFLFSRNKDLLVLPVSIKNSEKGIFGNQDFDGAILFNVDAKNLSLKGLIDHADLITANPENTSVLRPYHYQGIKRSLYSNNTIYTFSDYGMKSTSVKDLATLGSFPLISSNEDISDNYIINTY